MKRKERVADALARARRGERVQVYEDARRQLVPAGIALLFFFAAIVLLSERHVFQTVLGAATLLADAALLAALVKMRRAREKALVVFDADGVWHRRGRETGFTPWTKIGAGFAAPAARRFVVLLLPREHEGYEGAIALPSTTEFRANELLAILRIFLERHAPLGSAPRV